MPLVMDGDEQSSKVKKNKNQMKSRGPYMFSFFLMQLRKTGWTGLSVYKAFYSKLVSLNKLFQVQRMYIPHLGLLKARPYC